MPTWTRKLTWPGEADDDWTVLRDGFVVGRVYWDRSQERGGSCWRWALITLPTHRGYAETLEAALEKVRSGASDKWGHEPYGWG